MGNEGGDLQKIKRRQPSLRHHIEVAIAEFLGTAIMIFMSCTGCTMGIQGNISSLHVSLCAGLAIMVVIQMFGHISGAHVNPVVTLAALILNEVAMAQVPIYIVSQILGCITGYGFHRLITPHEHTIANNVTGRGVCVTAPNESMTDWEALGVEIILTIILLISICSSWDRRNSDKTDSVALRIGLVVAALNISASAYTGASMNPVRSFGPAAWTSDFTSHWVYWVGPTIGSVAATCLYKFAFLHKP